MKVTKTGGLTPTRTQETNASKFNIESTPSTGAATSFTIEDVADKMIANGYPLPKGALA